MNPSAAILVIGDEILSGRTREANMYHLAGELSRVGIDLREVRIVPDEHAVIVAALTALRTTYTHVFTSGGIGPTHDDITADAVAASFGVGISVRADARALLEEWFAGKATPLNEDRLRMARIPDGATLIPNPVSAAPGFTIGNVHVMAGVPNVFVAMVAEVLPTLHSGRPRVAGEVRFEVGEGTVAAGMRAVAARFPDLTVGSYPFHQDGVHGTNVVVRGTEPERVEAALEELRVLRAATPGAGPTR